MNKIIHYCWFGRNPLPESAIKCIKSWEKFFPDYEIKEWNEDNYDVNCCDYSREAYESKKWAFVSDLARFKVLYKYGGIYFDTDVEVVKSFDDIICLGSFMGKEGSMVGPGLGLGYTDEDKYLTSEQSAKKLFEEIIDFYYSIHFILPDGTMNKKTVCEYVTNILKKYGYTSENTIQNISSITVFPTEYFCPLNPVTGTLTITNNTHSIHQYTASWFGEREIYITNLNEKLRRILPFSFAYYCAIFIGSIKFDGATSTIRKIIKRLH